MAPDALIENDSEYSSAEDSDFEPEAVQHFASDNSSDSESDSEIANNDTTKKQKPAKRKRAKGAITEGAEDIGYENSGDEAIIENGLRRQRKKGTKGKEDDEEGGEGGFVKTRRMAALATEEKKPLASTETATVDVEAIWASMTSTSIKPTTTSKPPEPTAMDVDKAVENTNLKDHGINDGNAQSTNEEDENMIMIQRTYNFAGKVHTEEKLVPRESAEAKLWLESQASEKGKGLTAPGGPNINKPRRPIKKARRSIFEPITENLPQRTDLRFGVSAAARSAAVVNSVQAKKLNTVEKSKMDWAGFVDKEGIKDELETAGKAKGSYLDQKEFLTRVEGKRDEEARKARLKGV